MTGTRPTPWDVVFGAPEFDEQIFPAISDEASARGSDTHEPDRFYLLAQVGSLLRGLAADEDDERAPPGAPPLTAVRRFGPLLFHAYHFWRHGRRVVTFDERAARALLQRTAPIGAWRFDPPARAGYLQFPRNLLWSRITPDTHAEALDGIFWTMVTKQDGGANVAIALLMALGLREDRPGMSVMDAIAPLPSPPGHWGDADAREGDDFGNILPGGELSDLHGIVNTAELLKLVARAFHALDTGSGGTLS